VDGEVTDDQEYRLALWRLRTDFVEKTLVHYIATLLALLGIAFALGKVMKETSYMLEPVVIALTAALGALVVVHARDKIKNGSNGK
jgi:hypothetical protein